MTEAIQKFTEQDQADLARLEQQMEYHKEGAILFFEAIAEIYEREIYLLTHKNFKAYCEGRWDVAFRTIQRHLKGLSIRKQLMSQVTPCHPEDAQVIRAFVENAPEKSILETSKVKQDKRVDVILASHEAAKGENVTAKLIAKTAAKLAHKAIKPPEPEKRRDAWEATYGTNGVHGLNSADQVARKDGKRITLEEFRLMMTPSGLNTPGSATLWLQVRGERIQVTKVHFNRNDNELVLS